MTETATQIPLTAILPMLAAISERDYARFKELEINFASIYGVEVWEDVFNFRLKPALDKDSDRWLLIQKCSKGFTVKNVA
ncbi:MULTISPECIES: hypothetical protein [unclassified Tolypothrix]|uniref:hypothetical protein n=1 Tax=unclassified Tolypothrix TaxID=2649714 RepID=UPI0005EAA323|nr:MULTISPECIES: hypothetical protein [unclassified Tolypothrix]BAY95971.1 hypothetical protein NIES3275_80480 [Microchaete diplosiphon NIES-3275]EKE96522.1 hypothetical protein FDUTEX481_06593 [Tolypothrix sp. PCC 7601]MBE9084082.1 hypothetical protein [Tolypothrix sp. LEGE 11397]UYD31026.1 hypothetical protein HGR01_39810 [Tolypothrix sp. PCC 7712]UYD38867.1 hypothetical protein HG267_40995 [Tolypothrix sp. PCC 7601]